MALILLYYTLLFLFALRFNLRTYVLIIANLVMISRIMMYCRHSSVQVVLDCNSDKTILESFISLLHTS